MTASRYALCLACLLLLAGCRTLTPENQGHAERIITTLASDEMGGRYAYGPEAWTAARFIADEFEQIGLGILDGEDDYLQEIPLYTVTTADVSVALNGQAVAPERIAAGISSDAIHWTHDGDMAPVIVGPQDNLMNTWRAHRRDENTLLIVHANHQPTFARLEGFINRPTRTSEPDGGANLVMVLTDDTDVHDFTVDAASTRSETTIANVAGVLPGNRADEFVLFSAHYDHLAPRNVADGDSIFNGANDNASGATAVIELARHFQAQGRPERTLLFVGFTAEESGGFGSRYFSEQLDPEQIVAMFNIEMIGKPAVEGPNTAWITGFDRSDFGAILQAAVEGTDYQFYADPYPNQNLFYRSDNATLARLGVPAHSISTTPIDVDPDYHQVSDKVETLDLEHLKNTIKAIAAGAATIVSGERTPTRIDPATVN